MITSMKDAFSVAGKNVLITGGTRGIGFGIARAFAESGANCCIAARHAPAPEIMEQLSRSGGEHLFLECDVSDRDQCRSLVERFTAHFGRLDILINAAAINIQSRTLDMAPDFSDWDRIRKTNLDGVFFMCYYGGLAMKKQGGGIINISSTSAHLVEIKPEYQVAYDTSKAAVTHLSESLGVEWAAYNIRVNVVEPSYADTGLQFHDTEKDKLWMECWKKNCPYDRFVDPLEVGALCVYISSPAAEHCTADVFTIDGGSRLQRKIPVKYFSDWS